MRHANVDWTDEKIDILRRGAAAGDSSAQIGAELGCSRNAVIGKMLRMGIKSKNSKGHQRGEPAPWKKAAPKPPKARPNMMTINARVAKPPRIAPQEPVEAPSERPPCTKELLDLRAGECRWPEGYNPFLFCGEPALKDRSYCACHYAIAYQPGSALRRRDRYEEAA